MKNNIAKKEETLRALQNIHSHLAHLTKAQILAYFEVAKIDESSKHINDIKESALPPI